MSARTVDDVLMDAHGRVRHLEAQMAAARDDRSRAFAIAQQRHGRSAGDISRLLGPGVTPDKVGYEIRIGRRLLQTPTTRRPTT